jgi:hypothetical protein
VRCGTGARAKRALLPYMSYGRVLLTPVIVSFQVAIGAGQPAFTNPQILKHGVACHDSQVFACRVCVRM